MFLLEFTGDNFNILNETSCHMQNNKWCVCCFLGSFSDPVRFTVEGFVGDSAVLSCSIPESEIQGKIEKFSAFWRDDSKTVCDFNGGNRTCHQDLKYKDRVETFSEEYKKGNFSIKLNRLQKTDARKYICHITGPSQNLTITELHVKGVYNLKSFIEKP